jgi:transposase-like protein
MESTGEGKRERKGTRRWGGVGRRARRLPSNSHPFEVRCKAVQLCLEERFPVPQVAREMGVGRSTLTKWIKLYRDQGEAGLQS